MRHPAASSTESEELPQWFLIKLHDTFDHISVLPPNSSRIFSPARVASPWHLTLLNLIRSIVSQHTPVLINAHIMFSDSLTDS